MANFALDPLIANLMFIIKEAFAGSCCRSYNPRYHLAENPEAFDKGLAV